jgi:hypothetical protein
MRQPILPNPDNEPALSKIDPEAEKRLRSLSAYFFIQQKYYSRELEGVPAARYEGSSLVVDRPSQVDRVALGKTPGTLHWQSFTPKSADDDATPPVAGIIDLNPPPPGTFTRTQGGDGTPLRLTSRFDTDFRKLQKLLLQRANSP